VGGYRLTVRHGPEVERESYQNLDEAVAELERRAEQIRSEGGLDEVKLLREYEPRERVHARLEVTGPGLLRRSDAGIDVMGDGAVVPYRGAVVKRKLEPRSGQSPYDAVREALSA
jgi:hypothetical protein